MPDRSDNIHASLIGLLAGLCALCFIACGIFYIVFDMCPIIERLGMVGSILAAILVAQAIIVMLCSAPSAGTGDMDE